MKRKLASFIIGLVLTILFLEIAIPTSSIVFSYFQNQINQNLLSLKKTKLKTISIVVVGESTTAVAANEKNSFLVQTTSYPVYLERYLNQIQNRFYFQVTNMGIMAGNTSKLISELNKYLFDHNPDIIIAMMGMKDTQEIKSRTGHISAGEIFLQHSSTYRFIKLLYSHNLSYANSFEDNSLVSGFEDLSTEFLQIGHRFVFESIAKQFETHPVSDTEVFMISKQFFLANYYMNTGQLKKGEALLKKTITETGYGYFLLASLYIRANDLHSAQVILEDYLKIYPGNPYSYKDLGLIYISNKDFIKFGTLMNQAHARGLLGTMPLLIINSRLEKSRGRYRAGINLLKPICSYERIFIPESLISSKDVKDLSKVLTKENIVRFMKKDNFLECSYTLSELYYLNREYIMAERNLHHYNLYNGQNNTATDLLRRTFEGQGANDKALRLLKDVSQNNKRLGEYFSLVNFYKESNKLIEINQLYVDAKKDFPETVKNFNELRLMANNVGAKLVLMQYPTFSVDFLKSFTNNLPGVYYISNESIFNDEPKSTYFFEPRFPYDFNHYTNRGSQVLARHLAGELLIALERGDL